MPLSEYEQRVLSQMEQQLRSDPRLVSTFTAERRYSGRRLALGTLAVLAGLALLVGGVASGLVWLGVLGFVAMFGGVMLAISKPRVAAARSGSAKSPQPGRSGKPAPARNDAGFMQRLEERWDRRRDDRGR